MPFGKHKGEPIEQVLADTNYCAWLLRQDWLAPTYPRLHAALTQEWVTTPREYSYTRYEEAQERQAAEKSMPRTPMFRSELLPGGCVLIHFTDRPTTNRGFRRGPAADKIRPRRKSPRRNLR